MSITTAERAAALADQARQEMDALQERGVLMTGNGYAPILLVKGRLNAEEVAGGELMAGADGRALRAALSAIGWAPEDFCGLAAVLVGENAAGQPAQAAPAQADPATADLPAGTALLPQGLFREAVEALDPEAVVLLDDVAADAMREAYADALAIIEDFDSAMLKPGLVVSVLGRRTLTIDGFEASLSDPRKKQVAWAYLKQLAPLGAPY